MRQRLALAVSSLVAASVLAVGLSAAGFGPNAPTIAGDDEHEVTQGTSDDSTEATEPEVIYVKPAPSPKTVVKVKRTKAKDGGSAKRRTTKVRTRDRDDEHEHENRERERDHDRDDDHEHDDD